MKRPEDASFAGPVLWDEVVYVCPFASCGRGRFTNRPYGGDAGLALWDATVHERPMHTGMCHCRKGVS